MGRVGSGQRCCQPVNADPLSRRRRRSRNRIQDHTQRSHSGQLPSHPGPGSIRASTRICRFQRQVDCRSALSPRSLVSGNLRGRRAGWLSNASRRESSPHAPAARLLLSMASHGCRATPGAGIRAPGNRIARRPRSNSTGCGRIADHVYSGSRLTRTLLYQRRFSADR